MQNMNEVVQEMINWIEDNLAENPILEKVSRHVGYSPWYCSAMFHDVTNQTLKNYVAGRRLSRVTMELRDGREGILSLAVKYGYSSQEALTRAFKEQFGCTPAAYRKQPVPVPLQLYKHVLLPKMSEERMKQMEEKRLNISVEHIPAHKYLGIWEAKAGNYGEFWQYHSCDEVCGIIESMDKMAHNIVTAHTAGWKWVDGRRTYFYGMGMPLDYEGPIPEGFELREIPASDYLVFSYPAFDYMTENNEVMPAVENLAWNFDPNTMGYAWNEQDCMDYQRHYPEKLGYQVLRPVKKL